MNESPRGVEQASADLDYVRSVVQRAEKRSAVPSIYFLWAAISLPGMAVIDVDPRYAGPYWAIAGPLGWLLGWFFSNRAAKRMGQASPREGVLHAIQWSGLLASIFLLLPLIRTGALRGVAISQVILLFIAFGYLVSGNYLDRRMRWIALAVYAGYGLTFALDVYAWTTVGVILASSLVAAGVLAARANRVSA